MSRSRPAKILAGKTGQRRTAKYGGFGTKKSPHHARRAPSTQPDVTAAAKRATSRALPLPPFPHWFTIGAFFGTGLTACRPGPTTTSVC
ncbi:hypothetical protein ASA_3340 [Aeromonas salmonicida subsp. salmonicida A449]|uniref:Uncharacterized protein n=1 Tax=Aeromonas salmonicida (strain A449) TaxID=382245 RepID=A4SQZ7_AERS4|nr:hypothetical protein ASA_3340 [Aeromonas salmonicida subsp. salmonicida A449]